MAAIRFELAAHSMGSYGDAMCHAWSFISKGLSLLQYFNYLQRPPVFSSKLNFATLHKLSRHGCSATSCMQEQSGVLAQQVSDDRPHARQKTFEIRVSREAHAVELPDLRPQPFSPTSPRSTAVLIGDLENLSPTPPNGSSFGVRATLVDN